MSKDKKPQAEVGDGYQLLFIGEVIRETDQYCDARGEWVPAFRQSVGRKVHTHNYPYRRRVEPVDNTGVNVHSGGPYVTVEVHREALAEIERLKKLNSGLVRAVEDKYEDERRLKSQIELMKQPEPEPEWFDLTPHDGHVLRRGIDWFDDHGKWASVNIMEGRTVGDLKQRWIGTQFRCLLKDAPKDRLEPKVFDEYETSDGKTFWVRRTGKTLTREVGR